MLSAAASGISSTIKLCNGLHMPIFGLGTSNRGGYSHDAVVYALTQCGVRHIDTAERCGCEQQVGQAIIDSMVPREDLWITNKLWTDKYGYNTAMEACLRSLSRMGLEYFDLYLMHWPGAFDDPTVHHIAEKHQRTPAQIYIRWSIQVVVFILNAPDLLVFDLHLDKTDMDSLGKLHDGRHVMRDPSTIL